MTETNVCIPKKTLAEVGEALKANNFTPIVVRTKEEAFEKVRSLIPAGASLMNGASTTLQEIGFVDYLKAGTHSWNNLHDAVLAEEDKAKQALLRRQATVSDYYVGSAAAITENGEMLFASNSGSQLPHLAYSSPNIILVVGENKVVPTLTDALTHIEEHVVPLESKRLMGVYGIPTTHAKTLILHKENPMMGRTVTVILVKEKLGF